MSTLDELRRIIGKITRCDAHAIGLGTKLRELRADSLDWVQIIVGVETAFDIEVDIDKMQGFVTIEDFVSHIESFDR
jgi:acyl carrier protein